MTAGVLVTSGGLYEYHYLYGTAEKLSPSTRETINELTANRGGWESVPNVDQVDGSTWLRRPKLRFWGQ